MPFVSIIVPAYNAQATLKETMGDILAQTFKDYEAVIVDDGSTDETSAMADAIAKADSRVRVIHQKNGGLSAARNQGTVQAVGQYVTYIDSDDRVEPQYLDYLVRAMRDKGADIACAGIDRVREGCRLMDCRPDYSVEVFDRREAVSEMLTGKKLTVGACCRLEPREWLLENPFLTGKYYEDLSHTYKMNLKAGIVAFVNAPLYHYVMRSGSITGQRQTSAKQCLDYYEAINLCVDGVVHQYPELEDDAAVLMARDYMSLYLSIGRCGEEDERLGDIRAELLRWMKANWRRAFANKKAPRNVHWRILLFGVSPRLYEFMYYIGILFTGKAIG